MNLKKVLQYIANDNLKEALLMIEQFFENTDELKKQFLIQQAEYNQKKTEKEQGTIKEEDFSIALNITRRKILDFLPNVETLIEFSNPDDDNSTQTHTNRSKELKRLAQDAVIDDGYHILSEIHSELSSVFYKATKGNSHVNNDFYVVQLLNQYELLNTDTLYDQELLDFFSRCKPPFVNIQEFSPGNPTYIIREYVHGMDMNDLISRGIKLSLIHAVDICISIAEGLENAHRKRIVYTNLIPDELIVDYRGDVRILPMNIFNSNHEIVTWYQLENSVKYMSPEQLEEVGQQNFDTKLDPKSNQYSLGLILFFMITGEALFDGASLPGMYEDRLNQKANEKQLVKFFDSIHEKLLNFSIDESTAKELSLDFIKVFNKLIKLNPDDRYDKLKDFSSDMELLKLQIEKEKRKYEDDYLPQVKDSFDRVIYSSEPVFDSFYEKLIDNLSPKASTQKIGYRNIRLIYSLKYLLGSITNLDNEKHIKEAVLGLIKFQHKDFKLEDFEMFFDLLKELISKNDLDWNDDINEAWEKFNEQTLNAIESFFVKIK